MFSRTNSSLWHQIGDERNGAGEASAAEPQPSERVACQCDERAESCDDNGRVQRRSRKLRACKQVDVLVQVLMERPEGSGLCPPGLTDK